MRIVDGLIAEVGESLPRCGDARVLDASGCVVTPGLVDLHVHLREPGDEEAETIETGCRAAARGGFTGVVAMPNTRPPLDDAAVVSSVLATAEAVGLCEVASSGCITKGRLGEQLAPMGELHALGVRIFTDDGACVMNASVMRRALEYARVDPRLGDRAARGRRKPRRRWLHARRRVVVTARYPRTAVGGGDRHRGARHRALRA